MRHILFTRRAAIALAIGCGGASLFKPLWAAGEPAAPQKNLKEGALPNNGHVKAQREADGAKRAAATELERAENAKRLAAEVHRRFPVKFDETHRYNPGGRKRSFWLGAKGQVSKNGRVDFTQIVETKEDLFGFTGGVLLRFKDESGNIVWDHKPSPRGVDGVGIPFSAPSRRADNLTVVLDPATLLQVHSVEVIPNGEPKDTVKLLEENLKKAHKFAEDNKTIWEAVAKALTAGS